MGMLSELLSYLLFRLPVLPLMPACTCANPQSVKETTVAVLQCLSQLSSADKSTPWRPAEKARTVLSSVAGNTVT